MNNGMKETVTWKIGGEAGFGIMSAGTMLSRIFSRQGYHVFATNEYPSLIRGGHNVITVKVSMQPFSSMTRELDILIALNKETVELHKSELSSGSILIYDSLMGEVEVGSGIRKISIPFTQLIKDMHADLVMRNTVAIGASMAVVGADFSHLEQALRDQFGRKGEEVVTHNIEVAKAGYEKVQTAGVDLVADKLSPAITKSEKQLVLNGSEAVGVGAVRAGMKFAAIYPMTPINALITFLSDHAQELELVYKQPEDEIAGMNMALGASLMGVRSMVATSGGGFALMVEALSLSGMMELPVVIDLGMRAGPATGMPTWSEQGELQFAIHAGHGEFARIVLAPGDAEEIYDLTVKAFNLADKYQIPVFVLTDKYLNESLWCVGETKMNVPVAIDRGKLLIDLKLPEDGSYKRYDLTAKDGVSARSVPGVKGGFFISNGYEHDEYGYVSEDPHIRAAMVEKRAKKTAAIYKSSEGPTVYGPSTADLTFVTWGSNKGIVLEAMKLLLAKGVSANCLQYHWVYPFPVEASLPLLSLAKRLVMVEQNSTGQFAQLIREQTGIEIKEKLLKYDGRPWFPEEIVDKVSG